MSTMTKMDLSIAERKAYEFLLRTEEAKRWIEEMIQEKLPPGTANFGEMLRDGVALAKLGKIFAPTAIKKINKPASGSVLEFMAVDNISQFFNACKLANFPDHYVFEVTDLWELKNVYKVIHCLHTLSLHLYRNGLSIKMQNLQNANLKFSKEEIEKTQKMLEQMEETAMDFPVDVTEVAEEESNEISDESIDTIEELADPSMCEAEGEGLHKATAGKEAAFTIISKDSDGNILKDSNETFKVTLFYDDETDKRITIHANVQNNHDGTYAVTYTPEISGHYKMELVLFDTEMNEEVDQLTKVSPCNVTVLPSPESDPSKCTLSGQGIDSAVAGVETEFVLTSFDKFGNRGAGGEAFNATLTNEQNDIVNCTVEELGDGRYKFSYTCPKSSVYELKVNLGDVSVGTKQVTVKDAGVSDPSKCGLVGIDSVLDKKAGELSQFVIQARDTHGNDRSSGGEKFTVQVLRGEELVTEAQVTDSNDGKYGVEYSLTQSGEYSLHIKLGDQQLCEPKKITIHDTGLTDPSKCVFKGEDYLSFNAGAQMTASLEARDVYGNKREKGGDVFILQFTSKETMETAPSNAVKFTDNQNGEYGFEYVLEKAGEYAMEVLLKEAVDTHATHSGENTSQLALINLKAFLSKYKYTNVPGFPAAIIVKDAGVTDPRYVQFAGDGVSNALQGKDSEFVIKCRDRFMNNRTTGGENVEVLVVNEARKIEFAATVTDNNDGTYRVNYTPKASGKTKLIVKINGVQVDSEVLQGGVLVSPPNIGDASNFVDSILDHDLLSSLLNAFRVENDTDNLVDLIQKVREELIKQIRENTKIEGNVRDKERRIALLAENRYRAEEILNQPTGILAYFQKKKPAVEEVKTSDKFNIKDFVDYYSSLFYLLQTNPKYLAKCLFLVPAREMDTFLQTVTLTLYGYAFSPREEYLILSLFNETLQLEVQNSSIDNFLNNNPVLIKLVVNYCHERIQGKQFLQKILYDKILEPIIEEKDLNLNLNAVTILKERISQQEVETGVKSDINIKDMTYEKAMQDEYVSKLVQQRTKKMIDICQSILDTLIDNINELPYGLRYICRQLKTMLQKKNPEAPEEDVNRVVSYLLFFRFLNGPLCGPDAYNLTKKKISASMRNNLAWISKVLMRVSTFKEFDKNVDIHFCVMNNWIQQSTPAFVDKFMKPSISIPEPEEHLGVHQFIELTQKKAPTITITLNELAQTHSLLVKFMTKIAPDNKDPLREVLEKIKDKVPEQVDANKNEEISLPLQVRTNIENLDLEMKPEQLYEVTKENFRTILRNIGPQQLGENVEETIDKADSYADEIIDDSKKEADGILLKRKIEEIRKALPRLVEVEILSKDNHYRRILVDITKEIQNRGEVRKRQQRELERLKESLAQLREHNNFLKDKDKTLDDFVQQTLRNYFENKKRKGNQKAGNKKVYKFSYDQLTEKYKVIAEMAEGGAAKKKVKFQISMDESVPGLFTVEAKFASLTVRTIQIRLDDLLDKREKGESVLKLDGVTLNVNMTIWLMNKLFVQK